MHTYNRESLLHACKLAAGALRDVKPILRKLRLNGDTVTGTDLDIAVTARCQGGGADVMLPPKFWEALAVMPDESVTITTQGDADFSLTGNQAAFDFEGEDVSGFPTMDSPTESPCTLPAAALVRMIGRVAFAVAKYRSNRFGATVGVMVEATEGKLRLVATNGRQLALAEADASSCVSSAIAPVKALTLAASCLKEFAGDVTITSNKHSIALTWDGGQIVARQVEGRFLNYHGIMPTHKHTVTLEAATVARMLRQAGIVAERENGMPEVTMTLADNRILFESKSEVGRATVKMLPVEYSGPGVTVNVDPRVLCAGLNVDGDVVLSFTDGKAPLMLKADGYTFLAVPLRAS